MTTDDLPLFLFQYRHWNSVLPLGAQYDAVKVEAQIQVASTWGMSGCRLWYLDDEEHVFICTIYVVDSGEDGNKTAVFNTNVHCLSNSSLAQPVEEICFSSSSSCISL
jgi:hypothetical protein